MGGVGFEELRAAVIGTSRNWRLLGASSSRKLDPNGKEMCALRAAVYAGKGKTQSRAPGTNCFMAKGGIKQ